jgi:putative AbiEi antitoxin of type IV toxin-antitoxin system/uncharacterized protein DUF559
MGRESDTRSAQAWELAGRQHGIVTRRQLLALGFGARSIQHRVERGRLFRVGLGIYAVGWPALNQKRQWMAAVLAGGSGAALSHRSAAGLWQIGAQTHEIDTAAVRALGIDVSVRRRCELRRPGIRFRGRPTLSRHDIVLRDDIPVTAPVQTLVDLATVLDPVALERAVNDADKRELVDPEALRDGLARFVGQPGPTAATPARQALLPPLGLGPGDLFPPHRPRAKVPIPLSKQRVNRFEVDFFWPDLGLVVETDGLRYHRTPSAQLRDARRDRAHVMAGMTPLRFTHYEVRYEPGRVRAALVKTIAMLRERIRL